MTRAAILIGRRRNVASGCQLRLAQPDQVLGCPRTQSDCRLCHSADPWSGLLLVPAVIFEVGAPRMQINLLARNGWKRERRETIVGHGQRGGRDGAKDGSKQPNPTRNQHVRHRASVSNCAAHK
jgi:hypothetical protein